MPTNAELCKRLDELEDLFKLRLNELVDRLVVNIQTKLQDASLDVGELRAEVGRMDDSLKLLNEVVQSTRSQQLELTAANRALKAENEALQSKVANLEQYSSTVPSTRSTRYASTPRIEKDDIIVVLKPRETLDLKATFGPGQAGAAVRSVFGADASVGLAVWPLWDQNVLVCTLKSVDATERLLRDIKLPVGGRQLTFREHPKLSGEFCRGVVHVSQDETSETVKIKLSAEPNVVSVRKLGDTLVALITFAGTKWAIEHDTCPHPQPGRCTSCGFQVPAATPDGPTEHQCIPSCLLCGDGHKTGAPGCAGRFRQPVKSGSPRGSKPRTTGGGHKQAPTPKTGPKKAPAAKSNKPEPKKTNTGHSTNVKSGTPSEPPVLVKDFLPLASVQAQVSCGGGAVSGPSPSPSPTETALQQQIGELRRQNQILARKIQELEAKQVGSSEPVQEAEAEDGDDGSSVISRLTSVSRQDADTVVEPVSITGSIGRIESLEHKTEQLETSVAALPTQIMSAVRESFQDMFTAALMQALPEIVAQVFNSVLKAVQPWVIAQIKNTTQSDSPQVKRKAASRQAAEEGFSAPAPGPDQSSVPEVEELRILGLLIHHRLRPDFTIAKLKRIGEQVGRMIHRVSNKRGGLRGRDALRLAHAFVTSRILYAVPYLRTNKQEDERIDAIIRKATKRALDLPVAISNAKLRALGVLNS
ncbi:hypothetical protein HPB51_020861 [Rhipicephalus microplus]|uniref:Uncharacterized protein n=1 Tax=Rhipicephalus microplus TaxID=6941 RepID=A0A9J6EBR5_RHIMP|nr:hypothetical protein HPB51_020861 [Rhipicephalus microplus]